LEIFPLKFYNLEIFPVIPIVFLYVWKKKLYYKGEKRGIL